MDELFLYELFKNILTASKTIAGRFVVAEGYGNDLNSNSFDNIITDALGQLSTPQKYPVAILLPPIELVANRGIGWSRFKLRMFFLSTTYNSGANEIMGISVGTNTSTHEIKHTWKDMRQCAGEFRDVLNALVRERELVSYLREAEDATDMYERVSLMNNDRVSGVSLSFEMDLFRGCLAPYEFNDYQIDDLQEIIIPTIDSHQYHL